MQLLDMRGNRKYVGPLKTVKENEHILGSPEQRMKDQRTRFIKLWLPPILWAVLILVLSTIKPPEIIQPDYSLPWDKFMHFLVYAGLVLLILRTLRSAARPISLGTAALAAFLAATVYGIILEAYQNLVGRDMELGDAAANAAGAAVACLGYVIFVMKAKARGKKNDQRGPEEES